MKLLSWCGRFRDFEMAHWWTILVRTDETAELASASHELRNYNDGMTAMKNSSLITGTRTRLVLCDLQARSMDYGKETAL